MPASSSPELWERLIIGGDLQPKGYDQLLVQELRDRLGLPETPTMAEALTHIPIERFVRAFFEASKPFVEMWEDLLALFERAAASTGSQQLDLHYDFSAESPDKLRFNLESFRRIISSLEELMVPFDLTQAESGNLWDVAGAYRGDRFGYEMHAPSVPDVERFIEACHKESYPDRMPHRPTTQDARLNTLLAETWTLGEVVLADLRAVFGNYRSVEASSYDRPTPTLSGLPFQTLRSTAHDHWLPTLVATATVELTDSRQPKASLADALEAALQRLRNDDPTRTTMQERLEDLLSLPQWEHRYDLYSNWVTTQVVAALDDQAPLLHSAAGRIEFLFSGTHLATFDMPYPRVHLWTEYRSALANPIGKGRKGSIQPDMVLRRDPITANLTPLVVECKQYQKADSQAFADALTDYAHGHPDAVVVLVNYAGGREATVLGKVAPEVRGRTTFVAHLRPHSPNALAKFRHTVRASLGLVEQAVQDRTDAGRIELSWGASPRDLDLHIRIANAATWEIDYNNRGSLDDAPYARLENDDTQGNGTELVTIAQWLPAIYLVEVVNYSKERPMGAGDAHVTVALGRHVHRFVSPPSLRDDRWEVCRIDGGTATLT